ncbi:hypothetical protein BD779DRAFT_147732 [Infundibulicybe gibba]|nr:hypothetical protein BD779DRAFT_147732 [Infundibulicybe gibba]
MGSPYNYSRFAFPNAPHPTPASTTYTLRPPKPPIHNPYDKFPQSEFDAWIGGITGALRKALGQEPERAETPNREVTRDNSIDQDESFVDDSFAEIKARRQDKGKEKESEPGGDARFGAGVGNRDQPIHIDWDAEEVESGSPVAAPWTVEEEMEAEEVDVMPKVLPRLRRRF